MKIWEIVLLVIGVTVLGLSALGALTMVLLVACGCVSATTMTTVCCLCSKKANKMHPTKHDDADIVV
jgi:hypothetical protein